MSRPQPDEFFPVPWYPQENRPEPLDIEEAATSLFLSNGAIPPAAERLRVTPARLQRAIRKSPRLTRLITRLAEPDSK